MASPLPPPPPPSAARPQLVRPPVAVRPASASAPIQAPAVPGAESPNSVGKLAAAVDVVFFLAAAAGLVLMLLEFMAREYK